MVTTIRKWGNSLGVRIPRSVAEDAGLSEGRTVEIERRGDGVRLRIASRPKVSLDALVRGITPRNRHKEAAWGKPAGKEAW